MKLIKKGTKLGARRSSVPSALALLGDAGGAAAARTGLGARVGGGQGAAAAGAGPSPAPGCIWPAAVSRLGRGLEGKRRLCGSALRDASVTPWLRACARCAASVPPWSARCERARERGSEMGFFCVLDWAKYVYIFFHVKNLGSPRKTGEYPQRRPW